MAYDYASMIRASEKTYADTIKGYQSTLASTQAAQQGLMGQYNTLQSDVLGRMQGNNKQELADANEVYEQALGKMQQGMIGLNMKGTTVGPNLARAVLADYGKETRRINAGFNKDYAGLQSSLGLASLGYGGQAIKDQSAINLAQSGYMGAYGMEQGRSALGYEGLNVQREDQASRAQTAQAQMANQMAMAQLDATTRRDIARYSGSRGGGGGGSSGGGNMALQGWGGGGGGGGYHSAAYYGSGAHTVPYNDGPWTSFPTYGDQPIQASSDNIDYNTYDASGFPANYWD